MIKNMIPMSLTTGKLSQNVSTLREQIKIASSEAVTGRQSDVTSHLSGRIGQAMLGQKALTDIANDTGLLDLRGSRLDIMQQSLTHVQESIGDLSTRMQEAIGFGDEMNKGTVARDARLELQSSLSALNARHGQRFLFSGDATSTPPFAGAEQLLGDLQILAAGSADSADFGQQLDAYFNSPDGGWQSTIYQGTSSASDAEAVLAIDPAVTQVIRSLAVLSLSEPGGALEGLADPDTARQNAATSLLSGETKLTNLRAEVGIDQKRVADQKLNLEAEKTILTEALDSMTARDQYEAAAELKVLEQNLEGYYILTARLSGLSLLNFLR